VLAQVYVPLGRRGIDCVITTVSCVAYSGLHSWDIQICKSSHLRLSARGLRIRIS
jgi:hypothetical protein